MMDTQRLHSVIDGSLSGRQAGRTFAMCVEILQNTDFSRDNVYIYAGTRRRADWLKHFFWQIAVDMDYEQIENRKQFELIVNGVKIFFGHKKPPFSYPPCIEYLDHDYHNAIYGA